MQKQDIVTLMEQRPDLRSNLFARGFLFTTAVVDQHSYPFYDRWHAYDVNGATLLVNDPQTAYVHKTPTCTMVLIGHAYDPVSMEHQEQSILQNLCDQLAVSMQKFYDALNNLSGIFTLIWMQEGCIYFAGDPTCMQTTFYTQDHGHCWITSHTNLIGDLLNLPWDDYVRRLVSYRFFSLLGNSLPGDLTQFASLKRLVPNHSMCFDGSTFHAHRFYVPHALGLSFEALRDQAAQLLHNNLDLIARKWDRPAISMTGGCDSKTTLACAQGLYDNFSYFSYISSEAEQVDADAARNICHSLGLKHRTYEIPTSDEALDDIAEIKQILFWNCGGIRKNNLNDVRKRCVFRNTEDFDIEVKSWASEIGRAYYSKRFANKKDFGACTPRKCTTMYKFFFHNRKLVRQTDAVFAAYLQKFFQQDKTAPVAWQEQLFWEFRVPSWNGLVITGEHRFSFDITIPYNNRILLNLLLNAPLDERINDRLYASIREMMNPAIDKTNISVTNLHHTSKRAKMEKLYYLLHSKCPF